MPASVTVRAPSNIALLKYMGKKDSAENLPENPSLSVTLDSLCTWVEVEKLSSEIPRGAVKWVPEMPRGKVSGFPAVPSLDERGILRVAAHVQRVRAAIPAVFQQFGIEADLDQLKSADLVLRTANTFPASSGIASSASSFAGVTLGTAAVLADDATAFQKAWEGDVRFRRALAGISRKGSGSSCRSFEGPWVLWQGADAFSIESDMPRLAHFVILVSSKAKEVSSSKAHELVRSSPLWTGRPERATARLERMREALAQGHLPLLARESWSEAWEMHSLFHTCSEPFTYWEPETIEALKWLSPKIQGERPPTITLDAGPNVHVLVDAREKDSWRALLIGKFGSEKILTDEPGLGAQVLTIRNS